MLINLKNKPARAYLFISLYLVILIILIYRNKLLVLETDLTTSMILTPNITSKLYKSARLAPNHGTSNQQIYEMDGLVYFESREVKNQPLVVVTDLAEITAFDAIFTIESNSKETIVKVAEGLVELTQNRDNYKGNRTPLNIKPSQIGIIKAVSYTHLTLPTTPYV